MAARAMWKGRIRFGDVDVPVKLYSAIKSTGGVHFRLLHEKDLEPVKQQMVNPETGKVVEYENVRRAFPTDDGVLVMLDEDELAELEPEGSRDIEITRFVDPEVITHQWYDVPTSSARTTVRRNTSHSRKRCGSRRRKASRAG